MRSRYGRGIEQGEHVIPHSPHERCCALQRNEDVYRFLCSFRVLGIGRRKAPCVGDGLEVRYDTWLQCFRVDFIGLFYSWVCGTPEDSDDR